MVRPFASPGGGHPAGGQALTVARHNTTMIETEILRAELERLFELPDLLKLSRDVLGFEPEGVGGTAAKASFAGALTAHCLEHDAVEALCDALLASHADVNSKIFDLRVTGVVQDEELKAGAELGPF